MVAWPCRIPRSSRTDIRIASRSASVAAPRHRAGTFRRIECTSTMRLMRLRWTLLRGRSLWMSSGVHISGNQAFITLRLAQLAVSLHVLLCKLFAERQIHTVSKPACFRSRKDGAATDGTPMNHGPASAAGARRKLAGGAAAGAERFGRPHARSEGSSPTHQCALGGWGLVRRAVRVRNAILVDAVGAWMSGGGGGGGAMDGRLTGRTPAAAWSRCAPSWRRSGRRGTMWACSSSSVNPKHRFLQGKIAPVDWGASGKGDAP